jgi:hypothetical protein
MIKPLLDGFDPAGRPLLFYVGSANFGLLCALRGTGLAQLSKSGKVIRRDQRFAPTLLIREKQPRQLPPAAIAGGTPHGVPSCRFGNAFLRCPRCLEELRRRSLRQRVSPQPRSETGRRAVARSVSINQVGDGTFGAVCKLARHYRWAR